MIKNKILDYVSNSPYNTNRAVLEGMLDNLEASSGDSGSDEWFNDGNTHIWISLPEGRTSPMLGVCPQGSVTVDWGDGTEPDILSGTSVYEVMWTPNHKYAKAGDYVITLTTEGSIGFTGTDSSGQGAYILRYTTDNSYTNHAYLNSIRKVEMGNNVNISNRLAFHSCKGMEHMYFSGSQMYIGQSAFSYCNSLKTIIIPDGATKIFKSAFGNCTNLREVVIPDSVIEIADGAFYNCELLESIVIPSGVEKIASSTFYNCYSLKCCDFAQHTSVPTLIYDAFKYTPEDLEIRVPAALYDEWIVATNWTTYASQIVAV